MKKKSNTWKVLTIAIYAGIVIAIFGGFIFSDRMFFGTDMLPMGYAMRKVVVDYWRQSGRLPLWDPYILCGLPVVDAMHGDLFYPASLLYLVMPLHRALGYKIVLHVLIAGLTMFFLLRTLGIGRRAAFLGGLAYMIAPHLLSLIYAGHDGKMFVIALFPLSIGLLERLIRRPGMLNAVLLGGAIGLVLLASHPQLAYFSVWGLTAYLIFALGRIVGQRKVIRLCLMLLIAGLVGGLIGAIQILPAYYYTTNFSPRTGGVTYEFASSWSLHPEEIVSLLYPSFVGYLDSYWGRNAFKLNSESPGPIVLMLGVAGLIVSLFNKRNGVWIFLMVFCPIYALGAHTPIFKIFFNTLPAVKFLRAPSLVMFMFTASACVLMAYFLDGILAAKDPKTMRISKKSARALVLISVILVILGTVGRDMLFDQWSRLFSSIGSATYSKVVACKSGLLGDALALGIMGVPVLLLVQTAYSRKAKGAYLVGLVGVAILITSLRHSMKFIEYIDRKQVERSDRVIEYIKRDRGIFRVLPLTSYQFYNTNFLPIFGIETVNGFYDNRVRYFDTLAGQGFSNLVNSINILSLTNTKYVILSKPYSIEGLWLVGEFGGLYVYENKRCLPRAYIVHQAEKIEQDEIAVERLMKHDFDPSSKILIHQGQPIEAGEILEEDQVTIDEYQLDRITMRARSGGKGYLVYSGNYLPYWKAYVDGKESDVLRCNVSMMAVPIEGGDHEVRLEFHSRWYRIGRMMLVCGIGFVVAVLVYSIYGGKKP